MLLKLRVLLIAFVGLLTLPLVASAATLAGPARSVSPVTGHTHSTGSRGALALLSLAGLVGLVVKDVGAIAAKYKTRAQGAQADYASGVQAGAQSWEQNTAAAEARYTQGVADAAARGAFGKGVRGAGAKYLKNATTLGPSRFGTGVANAQDAYAAGMQPVVAALSAIQLPPKQVKGMNQERANIVATRLRALKTGHAS